MSVKFASFTDSDRRMVQIHANDEHERQLLDDVRDRGWHLIAVEADSHGPGFVYSVGLFHTLGHPEVIIFGFDSVQTMGQIINETGSLIRSGQRFEDGADTDLLLEGYPCRFRHVPADVYPNYLGFAMWFYRPDDFPVLQCFWPDRSGRFPWEATCDASTRSRQPILAHLRGWRFFEPKNQAVLTTRFVLDEGFPILLVTHDPDGDWQFLCGTTTNTDDGRIVCLKEIVDMSPGIDELADLPPGWCAERVTAGSPWSRSRVE